MPLQANKFDSVFSIGLIEHFENPMDVIKEQYRVLKPGGKILAYIVPSKIVQVQEEFEWINNILKEEKNAAILKNADNIVAKQNVYRSSLSIKDYMPMFEDIGFSNLKSSGIYSMPMISHSVEFPFTLLSSRAEEVIVDKLNKHLMERPDNIYNDPWLCDENYGHAILVWGEK